MNKILTILFVWCLPLFGVANGLLLRENKGQFNEKVLFKAELNNGAFFVEKNKLTVVLHNPEQLTELKEQIHEGHDNHGHDSRKHVHDHTLSTHQHGHLEDGKFSSHAISITFLNANESSTTLGTNAISTRFNYFKGKDPKQWAAGVRAYKEIWIKELYTGIDLHVYQKGENIKYDFIVKPFADPSMIAMKYEGADKLELFENNIEISTSIGSLFDESLHVFQNNETNQVAATRSLTDNIVRFSFGNYDSSDSLIIDPVLNFATFSGSSLDNWGYSATYDQFENAYGAGVNFGTGYPATVGAFQTEFAGGTPGPFAGAGFAMDISISKFNEQGTELIFATYLGGGKQDSPHSLVVNDNNELILFGTTSSQDFPVTANAYDTTFNGGATVIVNNVLQYDGTDIIVSKFSADGSSLLGSTYIGGSQNDGFNDETYAAGLAHNYADVFRGEIINDATGIYVATTTSSTDFPVVGGFQASYGGGSHDGCVFKLNNDLSDIIWSSYLGGSAEDAVYGLQPNSLGELYVSGGTNSANIGATPGANETNYQGNTDGFVAKISNNGNSLMNLSYVGGDSYDQGYFVQVDTLNKVYILGQSNSTLPISPTAYSNPNSGTFIHKYNGDLSTLEISTVVGNGSGSTDIIPTAFLVDNCGKIYVAGWSGSVNGSYGGGSGGGLPLTIDAVQTTTDNSDFYLMVLEQDMVGLNYGTYLGSNDAAEHVDGGTSRFNKNGTVYQAVCAACGMSNTFPTTPGAYAEIENSPNCNMAVFKFDASKLTAQINPISDTLVCQNDTIHFFNQSNGGTSLEWQFHDGTSSTEQNPWKIFDTPGEYEVTLIVRDPSVCPGADTTTMNYRVKEIIDPSISAVDSVICEGNSSTVIMEEAGDYFWFDESLKLNSFVNQVTITPTASTSIRIIKQELCSDTLTIPIEVVTIPQSDSSAADICFGDTIKFPLQIDSNFTYTLNPMVDASIIEDSLVIYAADSTNYEITITGSCGSAVQKFDIGVTNIQPNATPDTTVCFGQNIQLNVSDGDQYTWIPPVNGTQSDLPNPIFVADDSTQFTILIERNGCSVTENIAVHVNPPGPIAESNSDSLCNDEIAGYQLQVQDDFTYSWNTTDGLNIVGDSVFFTPDVPTLYELTITGLCGTEVVEYNIFTTDLLPQVPNDTTICFGQSIALEASGGTDYTWTSLSSGTEDNGNTFLFNDTVSDSFQIEISSNNCSQLDTVEVEVLPSLPPTDLIELSPCEEETTSVAIPTQDDFVYSWRPENGVTVINDSAYFAPGESRTYSLTIDGICGSGVITYDLDYIEINSTVVHEPKYCHNDSVYFVATDGDDFQWNPSSLFLNENEATSQVLIDKDSTYFVDVFKQGCSERYPITPEIIDPTPSEFDNLYEIDFGQTQEINLDNNYEYEWTPSLYLNCDRCANVVSEPSDDITYTVNYTDSNGCELNDTIRINVIFDLFVPNAFTPNGDGSNDIFYAYSHRLEEFLLEIYDRWGEKIFESNSIDVGWDGTINNRPAQQDVYVWKIHYTKVHTNKEIERVGTVTLIR